MRWLGFWVRFFLCGLVGHVHVVYVTGGKYCARCLRDYENTFPEKRLAQTPKEPAGEEP